MSPGLKFFLFIVFIVTVIDIVPVIIRLVPLAKRAKEVSRLKKFYDVISVEAEIIEIHTKRIGEMDTQYDIKLYYEVGWDKFYKNIILINKQSARVGQKVTLLCDSTDPKHVLLQNCRGLSGEEYGLKSTVINLIIAIVVIIADVALNVYDYISD